MGWWETHAISIASSIVSGVTLAGLLFIIRMLKGFIGEQREVNSRNKEFEKSMQRAEINRYFRIVVEQGHPVSPEELSHLEASFEAYTAAGGNGTGKLMYGRILEHAKIVTTVDNNE